jgi:hypothetical protein
MTSSTHYSEHRWTAFNYDDRKTHPKSPSTVEVTFVGGRRATAIYSNGLKSVVGITTRNRMADREIAQWRYLDL